MNEAPTNEQLRAMCERRNTLHLKDIHGTLVPPELYEFHDLCRKVGTFAPLAIPGLLARLADYAQRESDHAAEVEGLEERARLLFEAKNHWADRAEAAERERDELRALLGEAEQLIGELNHPFRVCDADDNELRSRISAAIAPTDDERGV